MAIGFFVQHPGKVQSSICEIVRHKGKRYKKNIGVSVECKYWNPKRQLSIGGDKYPYGAVINNRIKLWRSSTERALIFIDNHNIEISNNKHFWKIVECEISGEKYDETSLDEPLPTWKRYFSDYFAIIFIPRFESTKKESRIRRFHVILNKIREYENIRGIRLGFEDVNLIFHREFLAYMNERKYSINYFSSIIKVIRQVMREAHDIDRIHDNRECFSNSFKAPYRDVDTVFLTVHELERLHRLKIDDEFIDKMVAHAPTPRNREQLKKTFDIVRKRFLIGAFTGFRVSDYSVLSENNVNGKFICKVTKKTGEKVHIPLHWIIKEILQAGFDFNTVISEVKTREYLKKICCYAKINETVEVRRYVGENIIVENRKKWELVGTHTARRSFVSNLILAGVPFSNIMKMTGHRSEKEVLKYARISSEMNAHLLQNHSFFTGGKPQNHPIVS